LEVAERLNIQGRIIEVPEELLESSRQQVPEIIEEQQLDIEEALMDIGRHKTLDRIYS